MPKEKNYNPVQEAKKAEKQKQLRKQKATLQTQRNEKLARRNPARIQRDIDELKALAQSGDIRPHDRKKLAELEKDLAAVNKARAVLGDKAPQFHERRERNEGSERGGRGGRGGGGGRGGVLGKRSRDGGWRGRDGEESSDTDADVANIPMPRDTPPPIPRRRQRGEHTAEEEAPPERKKPTLVYEAAPQVRDLRKEAARFVPAAVAQKLKQAKGEGGLLEEEEFDKLEREGYIKGQTGQPNEGGAAVGTEDTDRELEEFLKLQAAAQKAEVEEKEPVAPRKPRQAAVEEVEDDEGL